MMPIDLEELNLIASEKSAKYVVKRCYRFLMDEIGIGHQFVAEGFTIIIDEDKDFENK